MVTYNPASQNISVRLAVSVKEAAHKLSVSHRHLYTLLENGDLKSFKSGRRRLISTGEIEKYITERMAGEM